MIETRSGIRRKSFKLFDEYFMMSLDFEADNLDMRE